MIQSQQPPTHQHFSAAGITSLLLLLSCLLMACTTTPLSATKAVVENPLKTPLIPGEQLLRSSSCSQLPSLSIMDSRKLKFGGCYLTNLRLIFEESDWYRALKSAAAFVPTSGDFGISDALSGANTTLNNFYIIEMGKKGELHITYKQGRMLIPLSDIQYIHLVEQPSLMQSTLSAEQTRGKRNCQLRTRDGKTIFFEMYDLPPHTTGFMPTYTTSAWLDDIIKARQASFGVHR